MDHAQENNKGLSVALALLRLALGFIFLWAFVDKLFGLGFSTKPAQSWLNGGSPAGGYLAHAVHGPLTTLYQGMAGNPVVDWLFMLGLLGIGLALILGIGLRIAAWTGALMLLLMWSSALLPANNPIIDEHIIFALALSVLAFCHAGDYWGFGQAWAKTDLVKHNPWLQ